MTAFLDARTDDVGATLDANVCIVGAGAAGISLARRLGQQVPGVLLVESGDLRPEGQTQMLFAGKQLGLPYFNLTTCRLRYFGGTTNHWGGYCRANDLIDYEGRPELGLARWPLGHAEMAPWIAQASEELGLVSDHFAPDQALLDRGLDPAGLPDGQSDILQTKVFQLSQHLRFATIYRDEIVQSPNITPVLNLNLCHIQLAPDGGEVRHLDCATLDGKKVRITARIFVICCHAIENARLLLTSNDVMTAGIGNEYDHVGRYFMDHLGFRASYLVPSDAFPAVLDRGYMEARQVNANLSFTDDFTREAGILQYYCRFNAVHVDKETEEAAVRVRNGLFRPGSLQFLEDVASVTSELPGLWDQRQRNRKTAFPRPPLYQLEHRLEQAPNPASRVVVSDRRDALGNLIADLDWRITEHDVLSFATGQERIVAEISALGYGRVQEEEITRELIESRLYSHWHQIGTTRMSDDPKDGVVDADLRVHGIGNLYIGGSSVFPTAGYSGPTMMLIGMAFRLADHLRGRI